MTYRIELTEDALIAGLRQYCRLAPAFKDFYQRIESNTHPEDAELLQTLQAAIKNADYQHAIYTHENVDLYLLYLIEHKKIPFWQGITQYTYWLLLIEFVDSKQAYFRGRPKNPESVKVHSLSSVMEGGCITYNQLVYNDIDSKLKDNKFDSLPLEKFQAIVEALSPSDRVVFQLNLTSEYKTEDYSRQIQLKDIMRDAISYSLVSRISHETDFVVLIPSIALTQAVFAHLAPDAIQMKPTIGVVGLDTIRRAFHQAHQHPVSLYSPRVKNNLLTPHNAVPSGSFTWVHDISHVLVGSVMTASMRDVLHATVFPWFKTGILEACKVESVKVIQLLTDVSDLNFVGAKVDRCAPPFDQLIQYISGLYDFQELKRLYLLDTAPMSAEHRYKLGEGRVSKDAYLYYIGKERNRLQSIASDSLEAKFFAVWYEKVYAEYTRIERRVPILKAIDALNNGLCFNPNYRFEPDYFELSDMITALKRYLEAPIEALPMAEVTLWGGLVPCQKTLLRLLTEANLKYFHPHLPMGRDQAQQLMQLLKQSMENMPDDMAQTAYTSTNLSFFSKKPPSPIMRAMARSALEVADDLSEYPIDPLDSSLNSRYSSARMTTGT